MNLSTLDSARRWLIGIVLAALALAAFTGIQNWRVRRAQRAAGAAALAQDTTRAHFDTSHTAVLSAKDSARLLGDSLRAVQRLVVQVQQQRDDIDKALRLQRIALTQLTAQVQQLVARVSSTGGTTETAEGERRAHFDVRQPPYTVAADVTLPRPPGNGDMAATVTLDPAAIDLRLGCAPANAQGIRSATATATGPQWLTLQLGRVEQSPELCASPALQVGGASWWRKYAPHVSAGYGLTLSPGKSNTPVTGLSTGWQVGLHWDLWRP